MGFRIFPLLLFLLAFFSAHIAAYADDCAVTYEAIVKLRTPEYPSSPVWNKASGEKNMQEQWTTGVALGNGGLLAAGERYGASGDDAALVLTEFDSHGRAALEKVQKIPGLVSVGQMLETKDGFLLTGSKRAGKGRTDLWIGFLDENGVLKRERTIADGKFPLRPESIVPLQNGNGFFLAASAEEKNGAFHPVFYKLDARGGVVFRRAFATGLDSALHVLSAAGPGYIGAGYMRGDDGRRDGWIVLFNDDAEIVWQRQYPRGASAVLYSLASYIGDFVIAAGEAASLSDESTGGWVMMVNKNTGDVVWQRFYTGDRSYNARGVLTSPDSDLFSVLLEDSALEEGGRDSTRLLTLTARGDIFSSDEFLHGAGTRAAQMLRSSQGEQILAGSTHVDFHVEPPKPEPEKFGPYPKGKEPPPPPKPAVADDNVLQRTMDGWVMAASPLEPYQDPCVVRAKKK